VQQIAVEVASLDAIPPELAQQVLEEYQQQATAQRHMIQGGRLCDPATEKNVCEDNGKELAHKSHTNAGRALLETRLVGSADPHNCRICVTLCANSFPLSSQNVFFQ